MNVKFLNKISIIMIFFLASCVMNKKSSEVICAKVEFKGVRYCSIPFVEMQANYNNLDDLLVVASGVLSIHSDVVVLVNPFTKDFEIPQPYNVVEIKLNREMMSNKNYVNMKSLHGKYAQVFGRFKAKNDSEGEWKGLISHVIEEAYVIASFE